MNCHSQRYDDAAHRRTVHQRTERAGSHVIFRIEFSATF